MNKLFLCGKRSANKTSILDIQKHIETSLLSLITTIQKQSQENYYMFLSHIEKCNEESNGIKYNYKLNDSNKRNNDISRIKYCKYYLTHYNNKVGYSYGGNDGEFRLNTELMMYLQSWESKYVLQMLAIIVKMNESGEYPWDIPDIEKTNRGNYILDHIKKPLLTTKSSLEQIITDNYNNDLRNSIAHSEYEINTHNKTINYYNKENTYNISFVEFRTRFLYSIYLSIILFSLMEQLKYEYAKQHNNKPIQLKLPDGAIRSFVAINKANRPYYFGEHQTR